MIMLFAVGFQVILVDMVSGSRIQGLGRQGLEFEVLQGL